MINLIIQSILELILTSIPVEQDIIRYIRSNFARTTRKYLIDACRMFFASWFEFFEFEFDNRYERNLLRSPDDFMKIASARRCYHRLDAAPSSLVR